MLDRFGVDAAMAAVYRARLLSPEAHDEELARSIGLAVPAVRDATARLLALGLVTRAPDHDGDHLQARSPEIALAAHLGDEERRLQQRQAEVRAMREQAEVFTDDYRRERERHRSEQFERLRTDGEVAIRTSELLHAARREVLALLPRRYHPETYHDAPGRHRDMLARGLDVRVVHLDGVAADPGIRPLLDRLADHGVLVRTCPRLPAQVLVVDGTTALVALDPHDPSQGAVVLHSTGLVAALRALFDVVWDQATELRDRGRPDGDRPRPAELELLRLLLAGHTDESSARALQVSPRTVRRMITDLQRRADAASRFELAARAVHLGWVRL